MTDRILAIIALATFAVFVSVVPIFVPDIDLIVVTLIAIGLAAFDFWRELRTPKDGD